MRFSAINQQLIKMSVMETRRGRYTTGPQCSCRNPMPMAREEGEEDSGRYRRWATTTTGKVFEWAGFCLLSSDLLIFRIESDGWGRGGGEGGRRSRNVVINNVESGWKLNRNETLLKWPIYHFVDIPTDDGPSVCCRSSAFESRTGNFQAKVPAIIIIIIFVI